MLCYKPIKTQLVLIIAKIYGVQQHMIRQILLEFIGKRYIFGHSYVLFKSLTCFQKYRIYTGCNKCIRPNLKGIKEINKEILFNNKLVSRNASFSRYVIKIFELLFINSSLSIRLISLYVSAESIKLSKRN